MRVTKLLGVALSLCALSLGMVACGSPVSEQPTTLPPSSDSTVIDTSSAPIDPAQDASRERETARESATVYAGSFEVGNDIPAGQWYIVALDPFEGLSTLTITGDSLGNQIVAEDTFKGNTICSFSDGQFVAISNAKMFPIEYYDVELMSEFSDGFYRVGIDITAGSYILTPGITGQGIYEICSDDSRTQASIVEGGTFRGVLEIAVTEGQYLKVRDATGAVK